MLGGEANRDEMTDFIFSNSVFISLRICHIDIEFCSVSDPVRSGYFEKLGTGSDLNTRIPDLDPR